MSAIMVRAVHIPADPQDTIRDVEVNLERLGEFFGPGSLFERVTSGPLRDELGTVDNLPVLVVDEEGRLKSLPYNERATILYVPSASRHSHWIAGDALVLGEGMTAEGPDFLEVGAGVGARPVADLIERYRNR